ncbi:MAG: hypothetical protein GX660_19920 [Clostridiaceae bacterium]|nr:hypothetical protein [Clostridiaceae bacterium]
MRKLLIIVFCISVIGMVSTLSYAISRTFPNTIRFEDETLEYVAREKIGSVSSAITKEQAKGITELDVSNRGIKSLKGIEELTGLTKLNLEGNRIKDVSPLCKLLELEELNLSNNGIISLEGIKFDRLRELTKLKTLSLEDNVKAAAQDSETRLSDISFLSGFAGLEKLSLKGNDIKDISPLGNLARLEELDLSINRNLSGSIEAVGRLENLKVLNIRECDVYDISPVENLKNLVYLNIHSNSNIKSVIPISKLTGLKSLIMRNVPVGNQMSFIENLTSLQVINLRNTSISDTTALKNLFEKGALQNIIEVDISDNPILISENEMAGFEPVRPYWNNITKRNPVKIPSVATLKIYINEVMTSNNKTINDTEGKYLDWIELYNPNEKNIDLTGYYLSDDESNQKKWQFPNTVVIPSKGYLIVWATGEAAVDEGKNLRTSFKVSSTGESIILTEPDGETVADHLIIPALKPDVSYGRKPDGNNKYEYFDSGNATPGNTNNNAQEYLISSGMVQAPQFSHNGGFYQKGFKLELYTADKDARIYYTLDGSEPVPENVDGKGDSYSVKNSYGIDAVDTGISGNKDMETRQKVTYIYEGKPIEIKSRIGNANILSNFSTSVGYEKPAKEVAKASVVRAQAYKEGIPSDIVTHTYFTGSEFKLKHSLPVVSITTDSENFFDYEKGIYVPGKVYDESFDPNIGVWKRQGNYSDLGDGWERPVHIELFEKTGYLGFSQNVGVRIHGATTRSSPRKTLRVHASDDYDSHDDINYRLFPGLTKAFSINPLEQFKFFLIRNSGNDFSGTLIRDALAQGLVNHTAIDTQAYRPVIMYLNGEYWGIHDLRERIDRHYFANKYDLDKDSIVILDNIGNVSEGTEEDKKSYEEILEYVKSNDMSLDTSYEYIKSRIDVSNYIDYYVSNIYFGNTDWPHNNVKLWRSKTGSPSASTSYGHDGKWRWILFDTDYGFGHSKGVDFNTLSCAVGKFNPEINKEWPNLIINSLLGNESFKKEFITRFADHLNSSFKEERVEKRIQEMYRVLKPEIKEHKDRWGNFNWDKNIQELVDYAKRRPDFQRQHLTEYFKLNGTVKILLNTDSKRGYIKINSLDIKDSTPGVNNANSWSGEYFKGMPIEITAVPNPGYIFEGWKSSNEDEINQKAENITIVPDKDVSLSAVFKVKTAGPAEELIKGLPSIEKLTLDDKDSISSAKELVESTLRESEIIKAEIKDIDKLTRLETKILELERIRNDREKDEFRIVDKIMASGLFLLLLIIAIFTLGRLRYWK